MVPPGHRRLILQRPIGDDAAVTTRRSALVLASLEHATRIARRIGALPDDLGTLIDAAIDTAWRGALDEELAERAEQRADELSDELSTDLASLARAAAFLARGETTSQRVLNLVDDFVGQADPEGERGIEEEAAWRDALAAALEHEAEPIARDVIEPRLASEPAWATRWERDWNR